MIWGLGWWTELCYNLRAFVGFVPVVSLGGEGCASILFVMQSGAALTDIVIPHVLL